MTPNGSSRGGSQQQQQRQSSQQPPQTQGGSSGHPYWELNRLSTTGRHFLLEPESRTGIVQDLQHRLQREQRRRREQQLRSNNNTQQQQQQKDGDEQQPSGESAGEANETTAASAADQQEVQEGSIQAVASVPVKTASVATEEVETVSSGKQEQGTGRRGSLRPEAPVAPMEKAAPVVAQPEASSWRNSAQSVTKGVTTAQEQQASEKSGAQVAEMRRGSGEPVTRASASAEDSTSDRQATTLRDSQRSATRATPQPAPVETDDSVPDRRSNRPLATWRDDQKTSSTRAPLDVEDPAPDWQGTAWRNKPKSASRASLAARTPVSVAVENPAIGGQEVAWNNHTKTTAAAPEPAHAAALEGSSAADKQLPTMQRNSLRSMAAITTTAATETGGQMSTMTMALLPSQPVPPCLQCLMRSLHESGLLGSCWMTAVLELEEAFAIKEVADACGSRFRDSEVNYRLQTTAPRRTPSKLLHGQQGVVSSGEGSAATPQADAGKWQALERLCHLRNSLRECPHVVES